MIDNDRTTYIYWYTGIVRFIHLDPTYTGIQCDASSTLYKRTGSTKTLSVNKHQKVRKKIEKYTKWLSKLKIIVVSEMIYFAAHTVSILYLYAILQ